MNELIADIYDAAAGNRCWSMVLTSASEALGVMGCQMIGVALENGAIRFSHASAGIPCETELEYVRTYHGVDPRIPLLLGQADGEWLYDQDRFSEQQALANPYYRDLLIPYGSRHTAATKLVELDGEVTLLAFLAPRGAPGFLAPHREVLTTLAFHLCKAARIYHQTRRLIGRALVGSELLQRMNRPAFLLDAERRCTFMNNVASRFLAEETCLLLARDRLTALAGCTDRALAHAVETMSAELKAGHSAARRIVRLPAARGTAIASLTPFVPNETMYAFGVHTLFLMVIHVLGAPLTPDVLLWEAAFNLTPSQSRVALELFRGHSAKQAATSMGVADTTIKSHLNELFAKTGTSRQAQLVLALAQMQAH
ncbi:MAG: hypothetical protein V4508_14100 [Pseudomonadota bacterium]